MSWIVRIVGRSGVETFLSLRLVDRSAADQFMDGEKAQAVADAMHGALGCYADVVDPNDAEARP